MQRAPSSIARLSLFFDSFLLYYIERKEKLDIFFDNLSNVLSTSNVVLKSSGRGIVVRTAIGYIVRIRRNMNVITLHGCNVFCTAERRKRKQCGLQFYNTLNSIFRLYKNLSTMPPVNTNV